MVQNIRCIGQWNFEGGGFVTVMVGGDVSTPDAIEWIERQLAIKKKEIATAEVTGSGPCFKAAHPNGESDPAVTQGCHGPETPEVLTQKAGKK